MTDCCEDCDGFCDNYVDAPRPELPPVNEYGTCTKCNRRRATACTCGMTFAERVKLIGLDEEALRIFNAGLKGTRKKL